MVDENPQNHADDAAEGTAKRVRRRAASRPAGPPQAKADTPASGTAAGDASTADAAPGEPDQAPVKKAARRPAKKAAAAKAGGGTADSPEATDVTDATTAAEPTDAAAEKPAKKTAKKAAKKAAKKTSKKAAAEEAAAEAEAGSGDEAGVRMAAATGPMFLAPDEAAADQPAKRTRRKKAAPAAAEAEGADQDESGEGEGDEGDDEGGSSRRRRRRRRRGSDSDEGSSDDPPNTITRVREPRSRGGSDDVTGLKGSTRLEAKKQRRREGREAGRRRAPILTEAEFLARRESVDRVMVVRQRGERTQIAVLEDGVLVEHYVTRGSSSSMVGNVYLGRVQNVLPSMEAAFVDIGRGRNAVLYAGEVNWDAAGLDGQPKRIEFALKSGDPVLVQVTKDPVGQKGARLTSQISLPGRFLVFVPDGSMTGISRKLPDTERSRLKSILKRVMPEDAGVIVRTAAEGAPEEALEQDVARLQAQWEDISAAAKTASPPALLYGEPDLAIKVVRDLFNEDVNKLVVSGDSAWTSISSYIGAVAPDLVERLQHWVASDDAFAEYRIDEQLMKALDRKVYLPSGGSLVIDRTEAMTVVDVNTGKFTGQGGNLEQTVTRNNLEAAEEIVRQLRLRDIGGIVVDFIDMVLESNRDLVLRRLVECLGRDRTKHQVAEVTSLGLVQMTRKRIGTGLIEAFSQTCETCNGRGIRVSLHADHGDHGHGDSPKARKPAGFVDPAEAAARALASREDDEAEAIEAEVIEPEVIEPEVIEADLEPAPAAEPDAGPEGEPEEGTQGPV